MKQILTAFAVSTYAVISKAQIGLNQNLFQDKSYSVALCKAGSSIRVEDTKLCAEKRTMKNTEFNQSLFNMILWID